MQIPHRPGDLVLVRRQRWRIVDVRPYEECQLVTLLGVGTNFGTERSVLVPFDAMEAAVAPASLRFVCPHRWRRACRALLAGNTPPGGLHAGIRARMDLLPHQ